MITATNPITGEIFEIQDTNATDIENAYNLVKSMENTVIELKDKLKLRVKELAGDEDFIETPNGIYRITWVQKQTYDKTKLRALLDEDLFDTFLEIKKSAVDNWLKENVKNNSYDAVILHNVRNSLIASGNGYEMVKFNKYK